MNVWIVTQEWYESFEISAVFSTQEMAVRWAEQRNAEPDHWGRFIVEGPITVDACTLSSEGFQ